jgi:NADH dehydrogenase
VAHAFEGKGDNNPRTVDEKGNRNLIDAARAAGVRHFVFTSILGVRPDHPIDFFRIKHATEQYLGKSGLSFTILRPAAFMEFWAALVGEPVITKGETTIFGRGRNPINFVSVGDVAHFAVIALQDPRASDRTIEIGGPENLSLLQVAETFERVSGRTAKKRHIPLPMMRVMAVLTRPLNEALSRQIASGVYMDTGDLRFDPTETLKRYSPDPGNPMTLSTLEDVVRKRYVPQAEQVVTQATA